MTNRLRQPLQARHALTLAAALPLVGLAAPAQTQEAPAHPEDPRPVQAVLDQLAALPPNHAKLLGQARVIGDFNAVARHHRLDVTGPRSRDYCLKMAWAPERGRALFCGANHGVPHRLNDVWEFDLAALAWILLYAPDNSRSYLGLGDDPSDVIFRDGVLITARGGPAVVGHTWWGLTYDPEERLLLFMNTWVTNQQEIVAELGGDPDLLDPGPPLWAFDPAARTWHHHPSRPPHPRAPFGGMLEFVPELGGTIWHTNNWQMRQTWIYDAPNRTWNDLEANADTDVKDFESQAPEPEQIAYHDPSRSLVIAHRHYHTHHFDPRTRRWQLVLEGGEDDGQTPYGHDAFSIIAATPDGGPGILLEFKTNKIWAYDPDKPRWSLLGPQGDPMPEGAKRLAYFDPDHGVLVVIDGTSIWAYRPPGADG
jgi:hypothetical protein